MIPGTGMHDHLTLGGPEAIQSLCPRESARTETVPEPGCSKEGTPMIVMKNCRSTNKEKANKEVLGKSPLDCSSYPNHFLQTPYQPFLPFIQRLAWKETLRQFLRVRNPPSSQTGGRLSTAPTKILPLAPVVTGSMNTDSSGLRCALIPTVTLRFQNFVTGRELLVLLPVWTSFMSVFQLHHSESLVREIKENCSQSPKQSQYVLCGHFLRYNNILEAWRFFCVLVCRLLEN